MAGSALGRVVPAGEAIVREGEIGNCMFVIQAGRVEISREGTDGPVRLAILNEGDFFGEMALFEREVRSATVRALGEARVLTVDRKTLMRRIQEDPSLAFNMLETLSHRIRELDRRVVELRGRLAGNEP